MPTNEEKYWNFVKNYNKRLNARNTNWLNPQDLGDVIIQSTEQNEPGCIAKILADIQSGRIH